MQIVDLAPTVYPLWNAACLDMDEAWFWHTTEWLEYTLCYKPNLYPRSSSFMVMREGRVLAICPLVLETDITPYGTIRQFSFGGGPGPAPALANGLSEKARGAVLSAVLKELDTRANKMAIVRASFRSSPAAPAFWHGGLPQLHPLLRFGFLDISLATHVIDLSLSTGELFDQMRKNHQRNVNRSQTMLKSKVYDASTIELEVFDQYRKLHYRAAGRVTRPLVTFEMMRDWIRQGMAILAVADHDGNTVGCALISIYKDGAYYSSGCNDPDCGKLPIGHALHWAAMGWMKAHGIAHYEIGIQPSGVQPHSRFSEKELSISLFKQGFGGTTVTLWTGEKFYSREYFQAVMRDRIEKFDSAVFVAHRTAAV